MWLYPRVIVLLEVSARSQDNMSKPTYMSVYRPGANKVSIQPRNPDLSRLPIGPGFVQHPDSLYPPRTNRSRSYSRRSSSPRGDRFWGFQRNMHAPMPQQQPEQRHVWSKQEAGQAVAADPNNHQQQEADKGEEVPRHYRLPQPPGKRTVPAWVEDCFEKDEMARVTGDTLNISFLREGVVPEVDMNLYLQLTYSHDGSHPGHYRSWARMLGKITHVYPPPEMGVYAVYEGQQPQASDAELQQLRNNLPALPPSLFGINASCSCCRTAEQVVQKYGAVHGQRVKARMWLTKMDMNLAPQLGGHWDIELILNDNLDSMWVLCSMALTPDEDAEAPSDDECQVLAGDAGPASHAPRPGGGHTTAAAAAAPMVGDAQAGSERSSSAAGAGTQGHSSGDQQQQQHHMEQRPQVVQTGQQQQQWQQRDDDRRGDAKQQGGSGDRQQRDAKQQGVRAGGGSRWDVGEQQQQRGKEGQEGLAQQQQQRQRGWDQQQQRGWKREQPDSAVERPFSAKRVQ